MQTLSKLKVNKKINIKNNKFQILILNKKHLKNSFDGKILGRNLYDWVAFACNGYNLKIVDYDNSNLLDFAKSIIDDSFDYTILLLSTNPLLESNNIKDLMEYTNVKLFNICKLPCGYIINNKYLLNTDKPFVDSLYSQNIDNFYIVENKKQYVYALQILQNRINEFHMQNGVEILNPNTVYIEPEVDIDSGVIIYPNNNIKGKTFIKNDVILKENNVIENCKIDSGCCFTSSIICNSSIGKNVYIEPFCNIENSVILNDCNILSYCKIKNTNIDSNSKIDEYKFVGEKNDSDSRSW